MSSAFKPFGFIELTDFVEKKLNSQVETPGFTQY
jgi:hypothetical protein